MKNKSTHKFTFFISLVCDDFKEDLVNDLPSTSFSYTGSPTNCRDANFIKFSDEENDWEPCDGSDLVLLLSGAPHVTMVAVKGRQGGFVKKFEVYYSWDASLYEKIVFSSKDVSCFSLFLRA